MIAGGAVTRNSTQGWLARSGLMPQTKGCSVQSHAPRQG